MIEEKVTLTGYNSKKQPYIFLVSSVSALIMGVLLLIFLDIKEKYACIICFLMSVGFLFCFFSELKQPNERIKIIEDRKVVFYTRKSEQIINLYDVKSVEYWPARVGLKMRFNLMSGNRLVSCMLKNSKEVRQYLLDLFEARDIKVIKRYSTK